MPQGDEHELQEKGDMLVSRDRLLELDQKKRQGRLTLQGQRIAEGENQSAERDEQTAKEN